MELSPEMVEKLAKGLSVLTLANSKASSAVNNVVDAFGALTKGTYDLKNAIDDSTSAFGLMPEAIQNIIRPMGNMAKIAIDVNDSLRKVSDSGIYFANDLGKYAELVTGARMSLQEFEDIVSKTGSSMNQLGLNANESASTFLTMAKDMQESGVVDMLRRTGMNMNEFNELLAKNLSQRKLIDYREDNSRRAAIESTVQLASEMDMLARLTGVSRAEQLKAKEELDLKPDIQLLRLTLDEGQQRTLDAMEVQVKTMGEPFQRAFEELSTGGIRSKAGAEAFASLGAAGPALMAAAKSIKSEDPAVREEGLRRLEESKKITNDMVTNREWLQTRMINAYSQDAVMQNQIKLATQNQEAAQQKRRQAQADEDGITLKELENREKAKINQERLGLTAEGQVNASANVSRGLNELSGIIKDVAANTGVGFKKLNDEVGESISKFGDLNEVLKPVKSTELVDKMDSMLEQFKAFVASQTGEGAEVPEGQPTAGASALPTPSSPEYSPGTFIPPAAERPATTTPSREEGTIKATGGKMFEDWGSESLVKLHGKEGVITEKQLEEIYKNTQDSIKTVSKSSADQVKILAEQSARATPIVIENGKVATSTATAPNETGPSPAAMMSDLIKGSFDTLGSRLERIAPKDLDRLLADTRSRNILGDKVKTAIDPGGKPMWIEPILKEVNARIEKMNSGIEIPAPIIENPIPPEVTKTFSELSTTLNSAAPDFRKAASEIMSGGVRTKEATDQYAAELSLEKSKRDSLDKGFFSGANDVISSIGETISNQYNKITGAISDTVSSTSKSIDQSLSKGIGQKPSVMAEEPIDYYNTQSTGFFKNLNSMVEESNAMLRPKTAEVFADFNKIVTTTSSDINNLFKDVNLSTTEKSESLSEDAESEKLENDIAKTAEQFFRQGAKPAKEEPKVESIPKGTSDAEVRDIAKKFFYRDEKPVKETKTEGAEKSIPPAIQGLLDKSKELLAAGDDKRSKIYEESSKRQLAKLESATIKEPKLGAETVKSAQKEVISTAAKEKQEQPKTEDIVKAAVAATKQPVEEPKTETPIMPVADQELSVMNEIKSELVQLNKNMRELISSSHDVADNSKNQIKATRRLATNNMIG